MTPLEHTRALKAESDRLISSGFAKRSAQIKQLQDDFKKLSYEQQYDLENAEYFDPAVFREIQNEVEQ